MKAHAHRRLTFHDVLIERGRGAEGNVNGSGPPIVRVTGEGEVDRTALVSISHDGEYATAVCMAAEEDAG